jgi:hypothetical protein
MRPCNRRRTTTCASTMGLPEPTLAFTIPSVYDDITLDCRIYHPADDSDYTGESGSCMKRKRCAIVAHPYAPLGGCCDDPVVGIVAAEVLKEGLVLCTFNFRYANACIIESGHS